MFSDFLRNAISESGKTQRVIADEAGITLSALANYIKGSRDPQFDIAQKLAKACKYEIKFSAITPTNVDTHASKEKASLPFTKEEIEDLRALLKASQKNKKAVG